MCSVWRSLVGFFFVASGLSCTALPPHGGRVASFETQASLYFSDSAGAQVHVPAGTYRVEAAGDSVTLTDTNHTKSSGIRVRAKARRHPVTLDGKSVLLLDHEDRTVTLLLMFADGSALEVAGARDSNAQLTTESAFSDLQLEIAAAQSYVRTVFDARSRLTAESATQLQINEQKSPYALDASGSHRQGQELLIFKGQPVSEFDQQRFGLVAIFDAMTSGHCSGVLISSRTVLTAGHCIKYPSLPDKVIVSASWSHPSKNQNMAYADAIYQFSDGFDLRGPDLALIHLSDSGIHAPNFFVNQLHRGAPQVGLQFNAFGTGLSTPGSSGTEVWRQGLFSIERIEQSLRFGDEKYFFKANPFQQVLMQGDSGGPDMVFRGNEFAVLGIHSRPSGGDGVTQVPSGSYSVSVPRFRDWIVRVVPVTTEHWWFTTMPSNAVYTSGTEASEIGYGMADVHGSTWAQAGATANTMCFNRGFVTGHFDGNQDDLPRRGYGVVCSGVGVAWRDVSAAEIATTPFGFTQVHEVGWAHANRAAHTLCERAGNAGGRFNGHQAGDKRGLICHSTYAATWFDATTEALERLGHPIGDLNVTPWAVAARAAKAFCRSRPEIYKTYQGGFFNGHQSGNKRGVICLRTVQSNTRISPLRPIERLEP